MFNRSAPFMFALALWATSAPAIAGDTYVIDPSHTHVQFSVLRFGFNDVIGTFTDVSGEISLDEMNPEKSTVTAQIGVDSLETSDPTRNEHLAGNFWFNTATFGEIRFSSTAVTQHNDKMATVTGDLTLLGVTKPVSLDVTLNKVGVDPATKKPSIGLSATGMLDRTDWDMKTAVNLIGAEVEIRIETLAHLTEE